MKPIYVTEPFLPPLEEYVKYLKGIWDRNLLSNHGPLVQELEDEIQAYHQIDMPVHSVANGGLGLQIILKALGVKGEVITTPFSYVATVSCPLWEGCSIQFADIEPDYLTIDPMAVEAAIGPDTEAIMATHVFGNPCDCDALEAIAAKHGLALIFDAAHAYGVRYKGKSILEYGDASMVSLHATKLVHAVEGGFVVARDGAVSEKIEWMRRFGHNGYETFHGVGINAKMSELHAAMGLCNIKHQAAIVKKRQELCCAYDAAIIDNNKVAKLPIRLLTEWNYAYYPLIVDCELNLIEIIEKMHSENIYPRRYFYPCLDAIPGMTLISGNTIVKQVVKKMLCLPLSEALSVHDVSRICRLLN